MANFSININSNSLFIVTQTSVISTECASIYNYNITANASDEIVITLSNTFENASYTLNGVTTAFASTATVNFNTSLTFTFSIQNSGNPGVFDSCGISVVNNTLVLSHSETVTRADDSAKCVSSTPSYDDLTDTPNSKIGNALKYVRVTADELNHEYVDIILTTIGTSGASTLVGSTLNIPQYAGGDAYLAKTQTFTGNNTFNTGNSSTNIISTATGGTGIFSNTISAIGFNSSNTGSGTGFYSQNLTSSTTVAFKANAAAASATGLLWEGQNVGATTSSINKTGDITANTFVKTGGLSTQYLKADGTVSTGSVRPYKTYVALVSQSGTSNPTAIVLENDLGGTVNWVRGATGLYTAGLTGVFILDKVAILITNTSNSIVSGNYFSTDLVEFQTTDRTSTLNDNLLNKTTVEIRIYP